LLTNFFIWISSFFKENNLILWGLLVLFILYVIFYKDIVEYWEKRKKANTPSVDIQKDERIRSVREQQQEKLKIEALLAAEITKEEETKKKKEDPRLDMLQGKSKTPGYSNNDNSSDYYSPLSGHGAGSNYRVRPRKAPGSK